MELKCWHIRPLRVTDRAYIRRTWIDSYRNSRVGFAQAMPDGLLNVTWGRMVRRWLDTAECLVACVDGEEDVILGWACLDTQRRIVHYVYVRPDWQRHGIARDLLGAFARERYLYSHRTAVIATETRSGLRVPDPWRHAPWLLISEGSE